MPGSVIVSGARTPIGKLSGAFADMDVRDLGAIAIKGALEQAGLSAEQVEYVIMGQVIQAGSGQNPARKASTDAGIPMSTPSFTLNKVCLSGLDAIAIADQMIQAGEYDIVVAGGMESMTGAPYMLPKARRGYKYGGGKILDATESDGLTDVYDHESMGASTEQYAKALGLSREEMDEVSAASHQRAADAAKNGRFDAEIVAGAGAAAQGRPDRRHRGRGRPRRHHRRGPGQAAPGVRQGGRRSPRAPPRKSPTAPRRPWSCPTKKAKELGLEVLARGIGQPRLGRRAGQLAALAALERHRSRRCRREGLDAKQTSRCSRSTRRSRPSRSSRPTSSASTSEQVNPDGGAISLGHPVGASGARLAIHAGPRAASPRWRRRCRGPLRRRRPGLGR